VAGIWRTDAERPVLCLPARAYTIARCTVVPAPEAAAAAAASAAAAAPAATAAAAARRDGMDTSDAVPVRSRKLQKHSLRVAGAPM
jgi:hypothetical protein